MENKKKTYVWGIPTRFFHWTLFLALIGAYIAEEDYLTAHVSFGYAAGILVLFRILWGFTGPRYSRFRDFPVGIKSISGFIKGFGKAGNVYPGHNPPASLVMLAIMFDVLFIALSGMLTLAQEGGTGLFSSLTLPAGVEFKEMHEVFFQTGIVLVIIHLAGILTDLFIHKSDSSLKSIFTGYKSGISADDAQLTGFQKVLAAGWILAPLVAFYMVITGPPIQLNEDQGSGESMEMNDNGEVEERGEDED
ncbi:MAG: cytochrome b/b6 domain-containing protein [Bacteroidales bacterium]|nr:cytochrome b/b6 domain-containing protein [Bacteroidales bacterium]